MVLPVIEKSVEEQSIVIPKEAKPIIQHFSDVFPEDLPPRLPPILKIQHKIDLI